MTHGKQMKTRGKTSVVGMSASGWGSSPLSSATSCRPRLWGGDSPGDGWRQADISGVRKSRACQGAGVMSPVPSRGCRGPCMELWTQLTSAHMSPPQPWDPFQAKSRKDPHT